MPGVGKDRVAPVPDQVRIDPPPEPVLPVGRGWQWRLVPALAAMAVLAVTLGTGTATGRDPLMLLLPITMVISVLAAGASGARGAGDLDADRRRYLGYLDTMRARLVEYGQAQRDWLTWRHPAPDDLWLVAGGTRCWERQPEDADFGVLRVGLGSVPPAARVLRPDIPGPGDPVTVGALETMMRDVAVVPDAPVTIDVAGVRTVGVHGAIDDVRALVRALICQLVVSHGPTDIGVLALTDGQTVGHWSWLKWLPHHRYCVDTGNGSPSHLLIVVDGADAPAALPDGVTALRLDTGDQVAADCDIGLRTDGFRVWVQGGEGTVIRARADAMTTVSAVAVARRLAGRRSVADDDTTDWLRRVGIADIGSIDPDRLWAGDSAACLQVPLGTGADGSAVDLDIREAADGGMGPHGLCVGATGSGKSELLRTIVLGMIARHSPRALNLILIDFKGGATFLGLGKTNHVSAVITNLADEAYLVDRMQDALRGEIDRRQRLLRAAGNFSGIGEYRRAAVRNTSLMALPTLFVVVDEFSELLASHPDFIEVFVAIGRLGRSLGIHLLLASQRLDEGRLRGLEAHLSYRICLKTLSAAESRIAIGVPDAYELPARPGAAYLKVGAGQPQRFAASFVSGPVADVAGDRPPAARLLFAGPMSRPPAPADTGVALLDTVVGALVGSGPPAHPVWLTPLTASPALETLLRDTALGGLRVPLGVVDRTFEHRRDPLLLDLTGAAGNVAVVGGPQTGKSTALGTLVTALASTQDPHRVQVYCLDFGGGALSTLRHLPHVGAVAGRGETELAQRIVAELTDLLRRREAGQRPPEHDPYGEVFLVVDGWSTLRIERDDLEMAIAGLAAQGLSFGIHVALSASRWADIRPALRDQLGTRLELRLGDPGDSEIDRHRARQVPRRPGYGLTGEGLPMVIALPGDAEPRDGDGRRAPRIRLLPEKISHSELLARNRCAATGLVIGMDERTMEPVVLEDSARHLLILGEAGCGKTATLRLLGREIRRNHPGAALTVIDPRGGLTEFGDNGAGRLCELIAWLQSRIGTAGGADTAVYVLVDDCELVASELSAMAALLPHARDIGLHLLIARHSGGAARALYEPVLAGLRDLGAAGLQLSAAPDDATVLSSVRPQSLPPGRAVLVTRGSGRRMIQLAWTEPA